MAAPPGTRRLAFIAPRFSETATIGGAETLLKALAERCAAAGCEVHFLTTCAQNHFTWENTIPPGTRQFGALHVHFFPVNEDRDVASFLRVQGRIDQGVPVTDEDERTWIAHSVNSRALMDFLRREGGGFDRIIAGPYLFGVTWFASQLHPAKTFLVPCLHDEAFAYLRIMKTMFRQVRGCLFNAEPERELARRLYGFPDDRSAVVGLGLAPFEADPRAFAPRHGLTVPYVAYAGRREPLKGTPLLTAYMHTFRERTGRDVKLVFTGSGQIDAPEELRPHIIDAGFVSEQEKRDVMAGAVAFIHPSVNESLGIVLLESWLARAPCLVHARSAVLRDQCLRSGGGLWFRTYPEFEEELLLLLDQPELRAKLAESGRQFVLKEYAWEAVERRLFAALEKG